MTILIVGAGHAGGTVAAILRQLGCDEPISIVGDEPHLPYQRPPLSKAWLKGDVAFAAVGLRPQAFYDQRNIALRLDARVAAIDPAERTIALASGESLPYRALVLATGARPRRMILRARTRSASTRCDRSPMPTPSKRNCGLAGVWS